MTEEIRTDQELEKAAFYSQIWNGLKRFPRGLAVGASQAPQVSGPAAAALVSAGIGCLTMMIAHHLSDTSKAREKFLWNLGGWIPGAQNSDPVWGNIGSYAGKETVLLIGWLVSWMILHQLWKGQQIRSRTIFFWMFMCLIAATAMTWHPLFPYLPLM